MRRISSAIVDDTGLERQTFRDRKLELFVWSLDGFVKGIELHYGIDTADEWSLRWTEGEGTSFHRVDPISYIKGPGDGRVMTPIVDEIPPLSDLHVEFMTRSGCIDEAIRSVVLRRLSEATRGTL